MIEAEADKGVEYRETKYLLADIDCRRNFDLRQAEKMSLDDVGYGHQDHQGTDGQYGVSQRRIAEETGGDGTGGKPYQSGNQNRPQEAECRGDFDHAVHGSVILIVLISGRHFRDGDDESFCHKREKQTVDGRDQAEQPQSLGAENSREVHVEDKFDQADDQVGCGQNDDILFYFSKRHTNTRLLPELNFRSIGRRRRGQNVILICVLKSGRDMLFFRRIMETGPKKTDAGGEKKRRDFDIQAVLKALAVV